MGSCIRTMNIIIFVACFVSSSNSRTSSSSSSSTSFGPFQSIYLSQGFNEKLTANYLSVSKIISVETCTKNNTFIPPNHIMNRYFRSSTVRRD
jgi:hypothetical protein